MMQFEFAILDFIQKYLRTNFFDKIMRFVSFLGDAGAIWILLTVILLIHPRTRMLGIFLTISLVIEAVCCNILLKPLIARTRPYDVNTGIELIIPKMLDYSFPSGHSAASFSVITALYIAKSKLWIPSLILGSLMAFSRLYLYVHYPSDVLCGIILGILSAVIAFRILKKRTWYNESVMLSEFETSQESL